MSVNDPYFGKDSNVTLTNPTKDDFLWSAMGRPYKLPAGATRIYIGYVANLCVKHFVDKMMNEDAEHDVKIERMMTNDLVRQTYADKIIVREDVVHETEVNEGIEEVDEGIDPKDLKEMIDTTQDKPATLDDFEKLPDNTVIPGEKPSNLVEDEPATWIEFRSAKLKQGLSQEAISALWKEKKGAS